MGGFDSVTRESAAAGSGSPLTLRLLEEVRQLGGDPLRELYAQVPRVAAAVPSSHVDAFRHATERLAWLLERPEEGRDEVVAAAADLVAAAGGGLWRSQRVMLTLLLSNAGWIVSMQALTDHAGIGAGSVRTRLARVRRLLALFDANVPPVRGVGFVLLAVPTCSRGSLTVGSIGRVGDRTIASSLREVLVLHLLVRGPIATADWPVGLRQVVGRLRSKLRRFAVLIPHSRGQYILEVLGDSTGYRSPAPAACREFEIEAVDSSRKGIHCEYTNRVCKREAQ